MGGAELEMQFTGRGIRVRPHEAQVPRAALYAACQAVKDGALINTLDRLRLSSVHVPRPISRAVIREVVKPLGRLRNSLG
jgi:hypothetical protein